MNTATATPAQIDAALAEMDSAATKHLTDVIRYNNAALKYKGSDAYYYETKKAEAQARLDLVRDAMRPLNSEFTTRGGWTRAFIVADGHVHSSMHCSTCNNGMYPTQFGWLTEFSGKTEAEVIEAAGSRACTVCYPDAPVDAPAGRLFHETEVAAEAARAERAAKKAAADAKKAANSIGPIKTKWDTLRTVYAAKGFLTDGCEWNWNHPSFLPEERDLVAAALGEKLGTTAQAQIDAAAKRAANR